jgi:hypothetical protein
MRTQFTGVRLVRKFDKVRLCHVTLTELAMIKPLDHVFEHPELYWVERGEDEYGWGHFLDKIAVRLERGCWMAGKPVDQG